MLPSILGMSTRIRIQIWDLKNKTQPFLELSLPQGLPLGLQLDPMILIGSDLTNKITQTLYICLLLPQCIYFITLADLTLQIILDILDV